MHININIYTLHLSPPKLLNKIDLSPVGYGSLRTEDDHVADAHYPQEGRGGQLANGHLAIAGVHFAVGISILPL